MHQIKLTPQKKTNQMYYKQLKRYHMFFSPDTFS